MYTGIIQACLPVVKLQKKSGLVQFAVQFTSQVAYGLEQGASVSVDGVCLTVVRQDRVEVWFDAMEETLSKTTLGYLKLGRQVNIERSATQGVEVGGHVISGHVDGMAEMINISKPENNHIVTFKLPQALMKYVFNKGFIALDGASLTVVDVDQTSGTFKIWFIPETLRVTTFGLKQLGEKVNVEVDYQTKVLVETIERVVEEKLVERGLPANTLPFLRQKKTWPGTHPVQLPE